MNPRFGAVAGCKDSICIHFKGYLPEWCPVPSLVIVDVFYRSIALICTVLKRTSTNKATIGSFCRTRILKREVANNIINLN